MKLLIDSHIYIWWRYEPDRLSKRAIRSLEDTDNRLFLSYVSLWELLSKITAGGLIISEPLWNGVQQEQSRNNLDLLPISLDHLLVYSNLPFNATHKDPFDRMLIAQALSEGMVMVSADSKIATYNSTLPVIW